MVDGKDKDNVLFKDLDLIFVYLFIFLVGILIVLLMTTYINNQVQEFDKSIVASSVLK